MAPLDWYSVNWLPWPADWEALFGRPAPLLLEIGFGSGLFLADLARRRPEANIIGAEIGVPSLRNAARKVSRSGLENVRLFQATAESLLQILCAPGALSSVTINFPDPWPKKDHHGRRLIDGPFLRLLASRMASGATLDIATDHAEYAEAIARRLSASPHFERRDGVVYSHYDPDRVTTKYEQLALDGGRAPHYFKWRRNAVPVEEVYPAPVELPMPHVVFRTPASLDEMGIRFRPGLEAADIQAAVGDGPAPEGAPSVKPETSVKYLHAYQSLQDGRLLIETYINEDPLRQRLCLEIRRRDTGDYVISLHEVGFPRPTRGVHRAVYWFVRWLEMEFPATVVSHTTLQPT